MKALLKRKERKEEILEAKKVTRVKKAGGRKSWEARGLFTAAGGKAKEMVAEEEQGAVERGRGP